MIRQILSITLLIILSSCLYAQPRLKIKPDHIKFEDVFHRLENVYLINEGDELLSIDSISYHRNIYYIRFDRQWQYPLYIAPGDTVEMDCILSRYFSVMSTDTIDSMYVYNNGYQSLDKVEIKIDFYNESLNESIVTGTVSDGASPVYGASVYFFYNGKYLMDSARTDAAGFYSKNLPEGTYIAAASTPGYYLTYYGQVHDPFTAAQFSVKKDSVFTADFTLSRVSQTARSISGKVFDQRANARLRKGIVIIRTGTHNPAPNLAGKPGASGMRPDGIYSAIVRSDGSYLVDGIDRTGYYYAQAFSDFYLPGYFNSQSIPSVFWQGADSILIDGIVSEKNIVISRDSSFGGGRVKGQVSTLSGHVPGDVTIYAMSLSSGLPVSFTYAQDNGEYEIIHLPYGRYRLIAQKIGFADAFSRDIVIDPQTPIEENVDIRFITTGVEKENFRPDEAHLKDNYPNPFNPSTNIEFYLPDQGTARLDVVNVLGQEVAIIFNGSLPSGTHRFRFDASELNSGVYIVRLNTDGRMLTRKIVLLK